MQPCCWTPQPCHIHYRHIFSDSGYNLDCSLWQDCGEMVYSVVNVLYQVLPHLVRMEWYSGYIIPPLQHGMPMQWQRGHRKCHPVRRSCVVDLNTSCSHWEESILWPNNSDSRLSMVGNCSSSNRWAREICWSVNLPCAIPTQWWHATLLHGSSLAIILINLLHLTVFFHVLSSHCCGSCLIMIGEHQVFVSRLVAYRIMWNAIGACFGWFVTALQGSDFLEDGFLPFVTCRPLMSYHQHTPSNTWNSQIPNKLSSKWHRR